MNEQQRQEIICHVKRKLEFKLDAEVYIIRTIIKKREEIEEAIRLKKAELNELFDLKENIINEIYEERQTLNILRQQNDSLQNRLVCAREQLAQVSSMFHGMDSAHVHSILCKHI